MMFKSINVMLFFRGFLSFLEVPEDTEDLRLLLTSSLVLLLMLTELRLSISAPGSGGGGSRFIVDVRGLDTDFERPARVFVRKVLEDGISEDTEALRYCCGETEERRLSAV